MTITEYNKLKVGDKIKINKCEDKNRVVTLGEEYTALHFKFQCGSRLGFMIADAFYPYQWCSVVKE